MNATTQSFEVGDHRINLVANALLGPGGAHHLSPEMVGVMETLAAHAGEPIGRKHIIDDVWQGDRQANRSLTRCISSLRHYLGDDPKNPQYIETIPGYGYRLIAPVSTLPEPTDGDTVDAEEPVEPTRASGVWQFFLELRERKVCRAALLYAVVTWLVFQIADVVFIALNFPDWALAFVVIAGVLGFPIALVLAWTFEVTPSGLVLDIQHSEKDSGRRASREHRWNYTLLAASVLISFQMLASGFSGFAADHTRADQLRNVESILVTQFHATSVNLETKAYAFGLSSQLRHLLRSELGMNVIAADVLTDLASDNKKADLVLQGSVSITEDIIRVMVHLVDPLDGHDLWSDVIYVSGSGPNSSQQDLARAVLSALPFGQEDVGDESGALVAEARSQ